MLEYSNGQENLMTKKEFDMTIYELQAEISKTLAHPLRLALLHILKDGEKTVNELVDILGASQSNISQHLALMRQRQVEQVIFPRCNLCRDTLFLKRSECTLT